jgi:hypothetical protein
MIDECFLNLDIDYQNIEKPDIDLYITGDFIG